jgi:UDP-2,4-diacetamido-2,4,6-trideoxy-beta-L-altropyranose hydrolase
MSLTSIYRADGSKAIGMGHLYRAFFLSQLLFRRHKIKTVLVLKNTPEACLFVQQRKMDHIFFQATVTLEEEINQIHDIIFEIKPVLFFLDILEEDINSNYTRSVRESKTPFVAITDDSNHRTISADLIINGNPIQLGQDYSGESGKYILGPDYFIMDPVYSRNKVPRPGASVENILLTFGGSDHHNLLFKVIDAIENIPRLFSITIITSKNTGYIDEIYKYLLMPVKHKYKLLVDVNELAPYWKHNDLAITAGGNTLFERIASRLPGATVCQLPRQMEIADKFEEMGVNKNFGYYSQITKEVLINEINEFISNRELHCTQFESSPRVVDGSGLIRVMDEINILLKQ